jgi:CheY-like chemotaxis protein
MGDVRILLLEDSSADQELITRELNRLGWSLVRCETTLDGFQEALSSFQPSLILADYRLAKFNADTALRLVRTTDPELPFILLTGTLDEVI